MKTIIDTPELIDDRASEFFSYSKVSFYSDHDELVPTKVVKYKYNIYCKYCSCLALPIQAGLRNLGNNYNTTGHTCACKGAMDEIDLNKKLAELDDELMSLTNDIKLKKQKLIKEHRENTLDKSSSLINIIKDDIQNSTNVEDMIDVLENIRLR